MSFDGNTAGGKKRMVTILKEALETPTVRLDIKIWTPSFPDDLNGRVTLKWFLSLGDLTF